MPKVPVVRKGILSWVDSREVRADEKRPDEKQGGGDGRVHEHIGNAPDGHGAARAPAPAARRVVRRGVLMQVDEDDKPIRRPPEEPRDDKRVDRQPGDADRRALRADAAERRLAKQHERNTPSRALAADRAFMARIRGRLKPQQIYDLLGPREKWREHIDGQHHVFGSNVYVEGLHRRADLERRREPVPRSGIADPKYNTVMLAADRYVSKTFEFGRFTVEHYKKLRQIVAPSGHPAALRIGITAVTVRRFHDSLDALRAEANPYLDFESKGTSHRVLFKAPLRVSMDVVRDILTAHYAEMAKLTGDMKVHDAKHDARHVMRIARDAKEVDLATIGESRMDRAKLRIIATTHKELESLHPYVDYNTRTNRLVLNRLLVEAGLLPTILHDPNAVYHQTLGRWIHTIRQGISTWISYARQFARLDAPNLGWPRADEKSAAASAASRGFDEKAMTAKYMALYGFDDDD